MKLRVLPFTSLEPVSSKSLKVVAGIYDVCSEEMVGISFEVVTPILLNFDVHSMLNALHSGKDSIASKATLYNKGDRLNIPIKDLKIFLGLPEFGNKADGGRYSVEIKEDTDYCLTAIEIKDGDTVVDFTVVPVEYFNRRVSDKVCVVKNGFEAFKFML